MEKISPLAPSFVSTRSLLLHPLTGKAKLHKATYDAPAHLRFLSLTKRAKAISSDDRRWDAFFARNKDQFSNKVLKKCSETASRWQSVNFTIHSSSHHVRKYIGAYINKEIKNTVDL
jgi:hypothetical protein